MKLPPVALVGSVIREIALEIGQITFSFQIFVDSQFLTYFSKMIFGPKLPPVLPVMRGTALGDKTNDGQNNIRGKRRLLTPSLPNRFLVLVPSDRAKELGESAISAFRVRSKIASSVRDLLLEKVPQAKPLE